MMDSRKYVEVIYPSPLGSPSRRLEEYRGRLFEPKEHLIGFRYTSPRNPSLVVEGVPYYGVASNSGWFYFGNVVTVDEAMAAASTPSRGEKIRLDAERHGHTHYLKTGDGFYIALDPRDSVFNFYGKQLWPMKSDKTPVQVSSDMWRTLSKEGAEALKSA